MQIHCLNCNSRIDYVDKPPKFCSECGSQISSIASDSSIRDDQTIAAAKTTADFAAVDFEDLDATQAPDNTRPISPEHVEKFNLETVGPYRILGKLGQGGMGTVYEAVNMESGRHVALKLLSAAVRGTPEMVQRFQRESEIAASINHPRSTFVYESGEHDGQLYITMELMSGGTLRDIVEKEGPLPVGRAIDYMLDIIDGLLVAHDAGIVHRDLKPSNSFVDTDGRIKVGDFGLAKSFLADSSLTQTGTFMGTPQYAAPEQIRNADVDERTDIYALGGMLFYLLSGRAPFVGNAAQVISSIATDVPAKVSDFTKNIPRPLVRLIASCLEKDPNRRPFNLNVVRDGLLQYSTRGAMVADPGRRMAAFFLDSITASFLSVLISTFTSPTLMFAMSAFRYEIHPQLLGLLTVLPVVLLYFSVLESWFGTTLGKWIFGMRVVDNGSLELPSFLQALIRSLMISGIPLLISNFASYMMLEVTPESYTDWNQVMGMVFKSQAAGMISWLAIIPMIAFARRENGYRCLHELASGTRVVRLSGNLESKLMDHFGVTVPTQAEDNLAFGQYEVLGQFYRSTSGSPQSTFLVKDKKLNRPLWLFDGFGDSPLNEERTNLSRPGRLRIIQHAVENGKQWYATESVPGLPLVEALEQPGCKWHSVCPLIRDVAYELMLSEENNLIPSRLTENQIWLDHTGRVHLLDHPLIHSTVDGEDQATERATNETPIETINSILQRFMAKNSHPVELIELSKELQGDSLPEDKYRWLVTRMNEMVEKPSSWNSVDRIGMTAISLGCEYSIIMSSVLLASFLAILTNIPPVYQSAITFAGGCLVVGLMAYFFQGGPALRLCGVSVRRNKDKSPASRIRATLRAIIGWMPWILMLAALMFIIFQLKETNVEVDSNIKMSDQDFGIPVAITASAAFLVAGLGTLVAILNPARGLQDMLTGTRLMRK